MAEAHPRALTAMVAGSLCALLATGPVWARPATSLLPRAIPSQTPGAAGSPDAPEKTPLAVVVVPQNGDAEAAAARLHFVARQTAVRFDRFAPLRLTDALDPQGAKEREDRAQAGRTALDAARDAYDNLDTVKSLQLADAAMKAWADTDLTLHMGDLTQAWLMKAASHVANGETESARTEIARLVSVNPDAQFSANYFPPEELGEAQKARKAVGAAEGTLEVRTLPSGAEVYVNGRYAGISPATVTNLADAEHFITVLKPGYALAQARAKPGQTELALRNAELGGRFEALSRGVTRDPQGPGRDRAAKELGQALGAEQVLLVHVAAPKGGRVKVIGLRLDAKDGHNLAYATGELPADGTEQLQQGDAFIASLLEKDAPRDGGPVTHFPEKTPADTKKLAGYGLIGTGAVVLGVGVFAGVRALGQQGEARRLAEARDTRAFSVADSGRTFAIVADVSWLVGLAAAGAGTYLAFAPGGSDAGKGSAKPGVSNATGTATGASTAPAANTNEAQGAEAPATATDRPPEDKRTIEERRREERRKQEEESKRRKEEERRKKEEEKKKREEEKRKKRIDDEDDLRNY